jgi:PAS domain S-box-containing protein
MTNHRPALHALRDSERFRLLLDQMPGILWTVDSDLVFTSSVGGGLPAIGLEPDQVVGVSLFDYFQTDDPEAIPIAVHRRALRGEECSFEFSWEERTFECHVEPFRKTDGTIAGAIGVAFDITHSKQAEEALWHRPRRAKAWRIGFRGGIPLETLLSRRVAAESPRGLGRRSAAPLTGSGSS